jgi:hydroxyacylglutathione hydrolase
MTTPKEGLHIEGFPVGPIAANCVIVGDKESKEAVVVDPGAQPERVVAALREGGFKLLAILHTHAHVDHVGGTAGVYEAFKVPVALHPDDAMIYENAVRQGAMLGLPVQEPPPVDMDLAHGQDIPVGRFSLKVLHTPGHSPGGVCFAVMAPDEEEPLLGEEMAKPLFGEEMAKPLFVISGDTLFRGSIGRTDLPGGSFEQLIASIRTQILSLDDETAVVPGHGPVTTVGFERGANPFLQR